MSLSEYLLRELRHIAERPTTEEILARMASRGRTAPSEDPTDAVRAEREAR